MWIFSPNAYVVSMFVLVACGYLIEAGGALAWVGALFGIPFAFIFFAGLVIGTFEWLGRLRR